MKRPLAAPLIAILAVALASSTAAMSQTPPERTTKPRVPEEQKPESGAVPAAALDRTPVLPPTDPLPGRGLSVIGSIRVEHIVLEGGTVLPEQELSRISEPYEGRVVTFDELNALRRELTEAYIRRGYVNSGVIIPDQEVVGGTVVLREVRGTLAKINITGVGRFTRGFINKRLKEAARQPLQIQDLQKSLELLQHEPMIQRVNARLLPGLRPGEAELEVAVKAAHPFQIVIGTDNRRSVSTGGEQATLSLAHLNLTGHADVLSVDLGMSEGRGTGLASFSFPISARDTRILTSFSVDDARIVEVPFDRIDIKSKTMRGTLAVVHPWIRDPARSLVSSIGIERKHSRSTLLGVPFSFSPGDREGKSNTTVVNVGVEWTARARNQILMLSGNLRRGLPAFQATINETEPDGRFTAFLGQLQYARRAGPFSGELLFRGIAQYAFDSLLGIEKMPVGGFNTVRGYRENQAVRDNGLATTVEWRIPIRRERKGAFDPLNLRIAPFADYGRSWDRDGQIFPSQPLDLCSTGVGLLWSPVPGLRADLYWAHPFVNRHRAGNNMQDKGFHFAVQYKVPL
jgi:hemolysin activation/secretion protein